MYKKTLSARLALHIFIASILLTILLSTFSIYSEFSTFKNNIYQSVDALLESTQETASEAIYKLDESIAQTLVDGVVANKYIIKSTLYDENKAILATKYEPSPENIWRPLGLENDVIVYEIGLLNQNTSGHHEIVIDLENSLAVFYNSVISSISLTFIKIIFIALIVYIISIRMVARPVESLSKIISAVPPGEKAPDIELTKQKDEIGLLAKSTANYINESYKFAQQLEKKQMERMELEEKLRHSQKMDAIGQLVGGIAHDFNNIMTVVLGNTSLLKNHLETNNIEKVRSSILKIEESSKRASKLTKQLLVFSRKDMVKSELVDIQESVKIEAKFIKQLVPETIQLEYELNQVSLVNMDKSQFELILMNLVINARDASDNKGNIIVGCCNTSINEDFVKINPLTKTGQYVHLTVTDFGHGISDEVMSKIFDPFYTTKEVGEGTGLGLSTVYSIVDQWNGFIVVDTEVGKGTTFHVYLPISKDQQIKNNNNSTKLNDEVEQISGTVIFCEDDDDVRDLTVTLLSSTNLIIHKTSNPTEAIELSKKIDGKFDLLITDVVMPIMNGKELSDLLSKSYDFETIYISGYSTEVIADEGVIHEDVIFIQKPFTKKQLLENISYALKQKKKS